MRGLSKRGVRVCASFSLPLYRSLFKPLTVYSDGSICLDSTCGPRSMFMHGVDLSVLACDGTVQSVCSAVGVWTVLADQWSPVYTVSSVLTSIQSLLTDPNPASPANPEAAKLFNTDLKAYKRRVRRCVDRSIED
jgi:ubiquitin-protein ligase